MFILCFFLLIGLHFFCSSHVPILRKEKDITQNPLQLEVAQNRQWDISGSHLWDF